MRVPLGVIGIVYESRPNVTADAAVPLPQVRQRMRSCAAASEAMQSNQAIAACVAQGLKAAGCRPSVRSSS